jgi:uncharacterized protein with von Willebrand factor type A (vWA) domain
LQPGLRKLKLTLIAFTLVWASLLVLCIKYQYDLFLEAKDLKAAEQIEAAAIQDTLHPVIREANVDQTMYSQSQAVDSNSTIPFGVENKRPESIHVPKETDTTLHKGGF